MRLPRKSTVVLALVLLVGGFLIGRYLGPEAEVGEGEATGVPAEPEAEKPTVWTCAMHPQIRLPEAGQCPICFMELLPLENSADEEDLGPRSLQMTEAAMSLAEIQTAPVERRSVAHEISMVGKVAYDETRLSYITSWVPGRLDRLFVDYTGVTVRPGDHLVEIYSPRLYSAQQELLQAIQTAARLEESSLEVLRKSGDRTVLSAMEKLRLFGLSEEQVQEVIDRGTPDEHMTIFAPVGGIVVHKNALEQMYVDEGTRIYTIADLSKVWVLLEAYESDLAWLRYGQDVDFEVQAYPGETLRGRIAFIDPVLDDRTRTVKVRLNVDNADLRLKPDMFVSATARAVLTPHGRVVDPALAGQWMCPMHPEVLSPGPDACSECGMDLVPVTELGFVAEIEEQEAPLVIPATAPLVTGKRAVVYVRLPEREKPTFEGREVVLGPRAGDWYVVREGLREGERVVVKGNFKIDSELQIHAKPSMMSPEGGAPPPGHDHGAPPTGAGDGEPEITPAEAPEDFRRQLGALLEAYLDLQEILARDGDEMAVTAQAILDSLGAIDMGLLEGPAHMAWMKVLPELQKAADGIARAGDLETRRPAFEPFTRALLRAVETFGYQSERDSLGVFHCPMALDGVGADWIQAGPETRNPYFGSAMLRCGSLTRALPPESGR